MGKILKVLVISFIAFVTFNISIEANAEESEGKLTSLEKEYLLEVVGYTEEEISMLPIEVARSLVEDEAESIDVTVVNDLITPSGVISPSSLTFHTPKVSKMNSDWAGYNKFLITSGFDWNSQPVWTLTDKLAIGFSSTLGAEFKATNGKIDGHFSRYYMRNPSTNNKIYSPLKTTTQDWHNNAGVAASYTLSPQVPLQNLRHGGLIGQYFYIRNTSHGTTTVKLEYGHKLVRGSVAIGIYPAGLGIAAQSNIDTRNYAFNFSY